MAKRLPAPTDVHSAQVNWPLVIGGMLVVFVAFIAFAGPKLAPHDPLKENWIIRVGDDWVSAPFPPFAVPGFPLGSDERGRDIMSLLMWAVCPTLLLVIVVTAVRLALGFTMGLTSGWSVGRPAHALDMLIAAALAVPVLIVALAVISVVGVEPGRGLGAFVIGLAVTGWAETARVVREQTRGIKGQPYVEAARARGGSDLYLLARHALPHLMPLLWVLFAFEVSDTMLTIAALGFLGYFIDEEWIMVSDFTAQRFSGAPELGQLLSTVTTDIFTGPWQMFAAGSMVFITVLGFNLLSAGLRLQLTVERARRRTPFTVAHERVADWFEANVLRRLPAGPQTAWGAVAVAVILLVGGGLVGWQRRTAAQAVETQEHPILLTIPGSHLWATERHDPHGTLWVNTTGPGKDAQIAWTIQDEAGFSGGPAVSAEGTVYVAGNSQTLYALDPSGNLIWEAPLPAVPVGAPALSTEGIIYVADRLGGLSAITPRGEQLWRLEPTGQGEATAGPIVAPDGTSYYTIAGEVQAVSPQGQPLWRASAFTRRVSDPPRLSPSGELVFLKNSLLKVADGSKQSFEVLPTAEQYFVGADGLTYSRFDNLVSSWRVTEAGADSEAIPWDPSGYAWGTPTDEGVTPNRRFWLSYTPGFQDARFVWVNMKGDVAEFVRFPHRPSRVIALDQDDTAYICGHDRSLGPQCLAFEPNTKDAVWQITLGQGDTVNGGALVPHRLYVTLSEGFLFAIGAGQPQAR